MPQVGLQGVVRGDMGSCTSRVRAEQKGADEQSRREQMSRTEGGSRADSRADGTERGLGTLLGDGTLLLPTTNTNTNTTSSTHIPPILLNQELGTTHQHEPSPTLASLYPLPTKPSIPPTHPHTPPPRGTPPPPPPHHSWRRTSAVWMIPKWWLWSASS